jgi:hypothetical protein
VVPTRCPDSPMRYAQRICTADHARTTLRRLTCACVRRRQRCVKECKDPGGAVTVRDAGATASIASVRRTAPWREAAFPLGTGFDAASSATAPRNPRLAVAARPPCNPAASARNRRCWRSRKGRCPSMPWRRLEAPPEPLRQAAVESRQNDPACVRRTRRRRRNSVALGRSGSTSNWAAGL